MITTFSSLSESGFIPTITLWCPAAVFLLCSSHLFQRVASFLPPVRKNPANQVFFICSHLFQRVASFLPQRDPNCVTEVFRKFSSLSESGFIPTSRIHRFRILWWVGVLISFREWLHSYRKKFKASVLAMLDGSHLFQRVASFLRMPPDNKAIKAVVKFSSLSESGFIPTG